MLDATGSGITDLLFLTGIGEAARATEAAVDLARLGSIAAKEYVGDFLESEVVSGSRYNGVRPFAMYGIDGALGTGLSAVEGERIDLKTVVKNTLLSLVPVVGTVAKIGAVGRACSGGSGN